MTSSQAVAADAASSAGEVIHTSNRRKPGAARIPVMGWATIGSCFGLGVILLLLDGCQSNPVQPGRWQPLVPGVAAVRPFGFIGMFFFGSAVTALLLTYAVDWMFHVLRTEDVERLCDADRDARAMAGIWIGVLEKGITVFGFTIGKPELLVAWFGLKVVVSWKRWTGDSASENDHAEHDRSRRRYVAFMLGTSLSLFAGVIVYAAMLWWVIPKPSGSP